MIVFKWDDDTEPVVADILEVTTNVLSPLALNKKKKRVLIDKWFAVTLVTGNSFWSIRKIYRKIMFDGYYNGAASTSGQTGRIYMLLISILASNGPNFSSYVRLRYHDP